MSMGARELAKRIIHEINLGFCLEDPTHEAEIAIVAKLIAAAIQTERADYEEVLAVYFVNNP